MLIQGTHIDLGAQNMHWEKNGAYTGEICAGMLRELDCHYVILGHSERRQYFGETDEIVNRKAKAALASSLHPIVCVGETLEEREAGKVEDVITTQVEGQPGRAFREGTAGVRDRLRARLGHRHGQDGHAAQQAQEVHALIRKVLAGLYDATVAQGVRIQYGGSVKAVQRQGAVRHAGHRRRPDRRRGPRRQVVH